MDHGGLIGTKYDVTDRPITCQERGIEVGRGWYCGRRRVGRCGSDASPLRHLCQVRKAVVIIVILKVDVMAMRRADRLAHQDGQEFHRECRGVDWIGKQKT